MFESIEITFSIYGWGREHDVNMVLYNATAQAIIIYANYSSIPLAVPKHTFIQQNDMAAVTNSYGPLVQLISSDAAAAGPAADAVSLWNLYHPLFSGTKMLVTAEVTPSGQLHSNPNVIGLATCPTPCGSTSLMWCCSIVKLEISDTLGSGSTDVFFHEVGHAVIPPNAVAPGRAIDAGGHWSPEEPHEIMGATIEFPTFTADYTLAAPDAANVITCDASCTKMCTTVKFGFPPACLNSSVHYHNPHAPQSHDNCDGYCNTDYYFSVAILLVCLGSFWVWALYELCLSSSQSVYK